MPPSTDGVRPSVRATLFAAAFTCIAGCVDAVGYLCLGKIYVANMSGNIVALGINPALLDGGEVWRWDLLVHQPYNVPGPLRAALSDARSHQSATYAAIWIAYIAGAMLGTRWLKWNAA